MVSISCRQTADAAAIEGKHAEVMLGHDWRGEQEGSVKQPDSMRNMQQYTKGSMRLRNRSCDVGSMVVRLQLNKAENAGAESAVAKSEWSSMPRNVQPNRRLIFPCAVHTPLWRFPTALIRGSASLLHLRPNPNEVADHRFRGHGSGTPAASLPGRAKQRIECFVKFCDFDEFAKLFAGLRSAGLTGPVLTQGENTCGNGDGTPQISVILYTKAAGFENGPIF